MHRLEEVGEHHPLLRVGVRLVERMDRIGEARPVEVDVERHAYIALGDSNVLVAELDRDGEAVLRSDEGFVRVAGDPTWACAM